MVAKGIEILKMFKISLSGRHSSWDPHVKSVSTSSPYHGLFIALIMSPLYQTNNFLIVVCNAGLQIRVKLIRIRPVKKKHKNRIHPPKKYGSIRILPLRKTGSRSVPRDNPVPDPLVYFSLKKVNIIDISLIYN